MVHRRSKYRESYRHSGLVVGAPECSVASAAAVAAVAAMLHSVVQRQMTASHRLRDAPRAYVTPLLDPSGTWTAGNDNFVVATGALPCDSYRLI